MSAPFQQSGLSFADKAAAAWGADLPDWVAELARLADAEGLAGCERRIAYSKSAVSGVINKKYAKGDLARVEGSVRGALMASMVQCPVLGEIGRDRCLQEQDEPFRATGAMRVQLYHACRRGCPHATRHNKSNGDAA